LITGKQNNKGLEEKSLEGYNLPFRREWGSGLLARERCALKGTEEEREGGKGEHVKKAGGKKSKKPPFYGSIAVLLAIAIRDDARRRGVKKKKAHVK